LVSRARGDRPTVVHNPVIAALIPASILSAHEETDSGYV
jgi:hypothetical protein